VTFGSPLLLLTHEKKTRFFIGSQVLQDHRHAQGCRALHGGFALRFLGCAGRSAIGRRVRRSLGISVFWGPIPFGGCGRLSVCPRLYVPAAAWLSRGHPAPQRLPLPLPLPPPAAPGPAARRKPPPVLTPPVLMPRPVPMPAPMVGKTHALRARLKHKNTKRQNTARRQESTPV